MSPKNWQMLRTNWYNCFRKGYMGYTVELVIIGYITPKKAKIAVELAKRAPRGSKIRKAAIFQEI